MTYVPIYPPDGEQFSVEWYISDGKAVGVERINDQWVQHNVGPVQPTGFQAPLPRPPEERDRPRPRRTAAIVRAANSGSARTSIDFVRDVRGK